MPFHYCAPFVFYRNMKSKDVCVKFRHEITSTRAQNTTYVIDKVCMIVRRLLKNIFKENIYNNFSPEPFGPLQDWTKLKIFEIGDIYEFIVSRKYHKLTPYRSGSRIS